MIARVRKNSKKIKLENLSQRLNLSNARSLILLCCYKQHIQSNQDISNLTNLFTYIECMFPYSELIITNRFLIDKNNDELELDKILAALPDKMAPHPQQILGKIETLGNVVWKSKIFQRYLNECVQHLHNVKKIESTILSWRANQQLTCKEILLITFLPKHGLHQAILEDLIKTFDKKMQKIMADGQYIRHVSVNALQLNYRMVFINTAESENELFELWQNCAKKYGLSSTYQQDNISIDKLFPYFQTNLSWAYWQDCVIKPRLGLRTL